MTANGFHPVLDESLFCFTGKNFTRSSTRSYETKSPPVRMRTSADKEGGR